MQCTVHCPALPLALIGGHAFKFCICSHSSYNYDPGGLDTYERDFIDDTYLLTPRYHKQKRRRKEKVKESSDNGNSTDSSDDVRVRRTKKHTPEYSRVVLNESSSNSDAEGNDPVISPHHGDQLQSSTKSKEEKGETHNVASEDSDEPKITHSFIKRRKKTFSLNTDSDDEEEKTREDCSAKKLGLYGKGSSGPKRRRLIKQPESDDDIRYVFC